MLLRLLVVLALVAVVARRLRPHRRMSWAVPLVLGAAVVGVRGAAWLLAGDG